MSFLSVNLAFINFVIAMEFQNLPILFLFSSCATAMLSENVVPVLLVSNVSGLNFPLLKEFLNVLPFSGSSKRKREEISLNALLFSIEEVYHVPQVIYFKSLFLSAKFSSLRLIRKFCMML